jgi:hypothetical protein
VRREHFEHVVAAAATIVGRDEFVVIGSQAILGPFPDAPPELLRSQEVDLYPHADPSAADLIDGAIGDGSAFQRTFGYYAHAVGPETAKAPTGWQDRLVRVEIPPRPRSDRQPVALCLEPHDLVLSKCAAGRERDWDFARHAIAAGLVEIPVLVERSQLLPVEPELREQIRARLTALARSETASEFERLRRPR